MTSKAVVDRVFQNYRYKHAKHLEDYYKVVDISLRAQREREKHKGQFVSMHHELKTDAEPVAAAIAGPSAPQQVQVPDPVSESTSVVPPVAAAAAQGGIPLEMERREVEERKPSAKPAAKKQKTAHNKGSGAQGQSGGGSRGIRVCAVCRGILSINGGIVRATHKQGQGGSSLCLKDGPPGRVPTHEEDKAWRAEKARLRRAGQLDAFYDRLRQEYDSANAS